MACIVCVDKSSFVLYGNDKLLGQNRLTDVLWLTVHRGRESVVLEPRGFGEVVFTIRKWWEMNASVASFLLLVQPWTPAPWDGAGCSEVGPPQLT